MGEMRTAIALAALVALSAAGSGCALLHARAPAPGPALDAPAAPPHDVPPPEPTPIEPSVPAVLPTPPPTIETTPAARENPPVAAPPAAPAVPAAPPPEAAPAPAPTLQTTPDVDAAIRRVRAVIDRASRELRRVNYQALSADGKSQYDTARRFVQQAEDALIERNVPYAGQLADKAAALAANLPKG
jgi:hypothetical protein